MIGKQVKGRDFSGCIRYVLEKENAELIGGNLLGATAQEIAAEFNAFRPLNIRLNVVVYHATLSVSAEEWQPDHQWRAIADDYLQGMGFKDCQYLIARHNDQQHDHIHIVASRIRIPDGKTVSDSWDYRRSEPLIRELEQKYNLTPTPSSRDRLERAPTTGEMRKFKREQAAFERGDRPEPPAPPIRMVLQTLISQLSEHNPSLPELMEQLQDQGIEVRLTQTQTNQWGISYRFQGQTYSGTQLGKAYTFNGLQHHKGVSYESTRDDAAIRAAINPVTRTASESTATDATTTPTHATDRRLNRLRQSIAPGADQKPGSLPPEFQSLVARLSDAIVQYHDEQALNLLAKPIGQVTESLIQFTNAASASTATTDRLRTKLAGYYEQFTNQLAERSAELLAESQLNAADSQQSTGTPPEFRKFKPAAPPRQKQMEL